MTTSHEEFRDPLLTLTGLEVTIPVRHGEVTPLRGVDLSVGRGQTLGLVGESGSGKTMTALSIMGLLPGAGQVSGGSMVFDGTNLALVADDEARRRRGTDIGMIFQDPMTSLNPTMPIGVQVSESLVVHERMGKKDAATRAIDILQRVGMPRPERIAKDYPHQLSGGMRQRAMIAMALVTHPQLLIADEPTTALDVTTQRQILDLIDDLKEEFDSSVILVTHDLGVVAGRADHVAVMYAGRVVETATAQELFLSPQHQYTRALLAALPERAATGSTRLYTIPGTPPDLAQPILGCPFAPRCAHVQEDCLSAMPGPTAAGTHVASCLHPGDRTPHDGGEGASAGDAADQLVVHAGEREVILDITDVSKEYPATGGTIVRRTMGSVSAVSGVTIDVRAGETFGLVGESGCGKSTLGRVIAALESPTGGSVRLADVEVAGLKGTGAKAVHRDVQMMFQDSAAAMDPRMRVDEILTEPLAIQRLGTGRERTRRVEALVDEVGLPDKSLEQYPHEFSGGQLQRIGLARSLSLRPQVVVCDEPVSALDVSVQAQVLNLMKDLQRDQGLAYVFISHDLSVVRYMSDRIGVMYLGVMVEQGPAHEIAERPRHPYTRVLIDAVPTVDREDDRERLLVEGELPDAMDPPSGCRFRTRCPFAQDICATTPPVHEVGGDGPGERHQVACHFPLSPDGRLPTREEIASRTPDAA